MYFGGERWFESIRELSGKGMRDRNLVAVLMGLKGRPNLHFSLALFLLRTRVTPICVKM